MREPNLLNVVGFIKVNESLQDRIVHLVACIRSFKPIANWGKFVLCLHTPSEWLYSLVDRELTEGGFDYELTRTFEDDPWLPFGTT